MATAEERAVDAAGAAATAKECSDHTREEEREDLVDNFLSAARSGDVEELSEALAALECFHQEAKSTSCCCCRSCSESKSKDGTGTSNRAKMESCSSSCYSAQVRSSSCNREKRQACSCCVCSPVNSRDRFSGGTALHMAAANGHDRVARFLIDAGAFHASNYMGNTPLHWAVTNKHLEVVKVLLSASSTSTGGADGIHEIADRPENITTKFIVDVLQCNRMGRSALSEGFNSGDMAVLQLLLEHPSAQALEDLYATAQQQPDKESQQPLSQQQQQRQPVFLSHANKTTSSGSHSFSSSKNKNVCSPQPPSSAPLHLESQPLHQSTTSFTATAAAVQQQITNVSATASMTTTAAVDSHSRPPGELTSSSRNYCSSGGSSNTSTESSRKRLDSNSINNSSRPSSTSSSTTRTTTNNSTSSCSTSSRIRNSRDNSSSSRRGDVIMVREAQRGTLCKEICSRSHLKEVVQGGPAAEAFMMGAVVSKKDQRKSRTCAAESAVVQVVVHALHLPSTAASIPPHPFSLQQNALQEPVGGSAGMAEDLLFFRHPEKNPSSKPASPLLHTTSTGVAVGACSEEGFDPSGTALSCDSSQSPAAATKLSNGTDGRLNSSQIPGVDLFVREVGLAWWGAAFGSNPSRDDTTGVQLWTSAVVAAYWMAHLASQNVFKNKRVLEIGAGCGLMGVVAACASTSTLKELLLTDAFPHALSNLQAVLDLNGLSSIRSTQNNSSSINHINSQINTNNSSDNINQKNENSNSHTSSQNNLCSSHHTSTHKNSNSSSNNNTQTHSNTTSQTRIEINTNTSSNNICQNHSNSSSHISSQNNTIDSSDSISQTHSNSSSHTSSQINTINSSNNTCQNQSNSSSHTSSEIDTNNSSDSSSQTHSNTTSHTRIEINTNNSTNNISQNNSNSSSHISSEINTMNSSNKTCQNQSNSSHIDRHSTSSENSSNSSRNNRRNSPYENNRSQSEKQKEEIHETKKKAEVAEVAELNWYSKRVSWPRKGKACWDTILGSDLLYEARAVRPLARAVASLLKRPFGEFYYVFRSERDGANLFVPELQRLGLHCEIFTPPEEYFTNPFVDKSAAEAEILLPEFHCRDFVMLRCTWK